MDGKKVREVCEGYRKEIDHLWRARCKATCATHRPLVSARLGTDDMAVNATEIREERAVMQHLAFVAEETPRLYDAGRIEKAMRWLGWLQGALWGLGAESLEEAKRRNMPDEEKGA